MNRLDRSVLPDQLELSRVAEVEQSGNHTEHPLVINELAPPDSCHAPPFLEATGQSAEDVQDRFASSNDLGFDGVIVLLARIRELAAEFGKRDHKRKVTLITQDIFGIFSIANSENQIVPVNVYWQ